MNGSSRARTIIALTGFLFIAAFFLATEHRAHLFGVLPFLFLLACPLLHLFMHGGHGGHRSTDAAANGRGSHAHSGHRGGLR